jgi:protein TonB
VEDVSVDHSDPPGVFDRAALGAIRRWKYEPRYEDGLPAEAHLKVHVQFKGGAVSY